MSSGNSFSAPRMNKAREQVERLCICCNYICTWSFHHSSGASITWNFHTLYKDPEIVPAVAGSSSSYVKYCYNMSGNLQTLHFLTLLLRFFHSLFSLQDVMVPCSQIALCHWWLQLIWWGRKTTGANYRHGAFMILRHQLGYTLPQDLLRRDYSLLQKHTEVQQHLIP